MRRLLSGTCLAVLACAALLLSGCGGKIEIPIPPIGPPTTSPPATQPPAPPEPQCSEMLSVNCWHMTPPSTVWRYSCAAPWLPDGAVTVDKPENCPKPPAAPPVTCTIAEQSGWLNVTSSTTQERRDAVDSAIKRVIAANSSFFTADQAKLMKGGQPGVDAYFALVAAELAKSQICAGTVPEPVDKLFVMRSDGGVEAYHLVNYGDWSLLTTQAALIRGGIWAPPSSSSGASCGDPQPPGLASWGIHPHVPVGYWDVTPKAHGCEYCAAIGYTDGRCDCPVRTGEGEEKVACEQFIVGERASPSSPARWASPTC